MSNITLKEAIDIARERNNKFDAVQEYKDAWEFYIDDGIERYGGGDCGIVVLKDGGEIMRFYEYFLNPKRRVLKCGKPFHISTVV